MSGLHFPEVRPEWAWPLQDALPCSWQWPGGALLPPAHLPWSAGCPSGNQGPLSPGGTSVKGLLWTLTPLSARHWNQSDVWVRGKEKLAGCPWCGLCCTWTCPSFLTRL